MISMPAERYIELDVTYQCSAKCAHCCFACSPSKPGVMTVEDAANYIAEAGTLGLTGRQITLTGGEPLLYYETVLDIIKAAAELGMTPIHAIQSNGSWAVKDDVTRERFTALHEAGLGGMFFSQDVYHRPFVPVDRVRRAVKFADEIFGAENVSVGREFLAMDDAPSVEEHASTLREQAPVMVGRSAWALADYVDTVPLEEIRRQKCTGRNMDLDPRTVWQINVDPWGWVSSWICSGIVLGNAKARPLSEILTQDFEDFPPIVQAIVEQGPCAMLDMAAGHGYEPRDRYVSKCHLCYDVRTAIHQHYPDRFAPAMLYED